MGQTITSVYGSSGAAMVLIPTLPGLLSPNKAKLRPFTLNLNQFICTQEEKVKQ